MSSFSLYVPSTSKHTGDWDRINAGQLNRLYPNKATVGQNAS
jgi:hypothetical protein